MQSVWLEKSSIWSQWLFIKKYQEIFLDTMIKGKRENKNSKDNILCISYSTFTFEHKSLFYDIQWVIYKVCTINVTTQAGEQVIPY